MMLEPQPAPLEDDLIVSGARVTRQHLIVLCCAHSVVSLVEEVARNLEGLGFPVEVVCGAEARSALLGRPKDDAPTIYVVCVQGTLKEQVLRPLRQALAAHGGPNQHLFVAVLDLALPLAMVGQIRRFAEALERPGRKGRDGLGERRMWREHLGPHTIERVPTRSYRALEVAERTSPPTASLSEGPRRTGPQTVIGTGRPAKVGVTAKYRAITGQLPTTDDIDPPASSNKRKRKVHAPKVKVKAVRGRTRKPGVPEPVRDDAVVDAKPSDDVAAPEKDVVAPTVADDRHAPSVPKVPLPSEVSFPEPSPVVVHRRRWPLAVGAIAIAGLGVGVWQFGPFASRRDDPRPGKPAAVASSSEPAIPTTPTREPPPSPVPAAMAKPDAPTPESPTPEPSAVASPPTPTAAPVPAEPEEPDAPTTRSDEAVLSAAAARRRLYTTQQLYVTPMQDTAVSWAMARHLCAQYSIDGVGGFRLPYRRELLAAHIGGWLGDAPHWSRTIAEDDPSSAYVLHPSTGQLTIWLKDEAAAVVCVHKRG